MPLTTDEKLLALSRKTIETFDQANGGVHARFRPAHAKGVLLRVVFTLPVAGNEYLDDVTAAARSPDFPFDEMNVRVAKESVRFRIIVQLTADGDLTDDVTVRWPEDRPQLTFGELNLNEIAANNAGEQQHIIFDPIPRVDGIEASADPLFEPRANIYLMSGRRRRAAGAQA